MPDWAISELLERFDGTMENITTLLQKLWPMALHKAAIDILFILLLGAILAIAGLSQYLRIRKQLILSGLDHKDPESYPPYTAVGAVFFVLGMTLLLSSVRDLLTLEWLAVKKILLLMGE